MLIFIVGITQAEAFVLHLAPPTPSKRQKCRITTNPLITTRRFDQRRFGIATEATMLAGHPFGFHAVIRHALSWYVGMGLACREFTRQVHCTAKRSMLSEHVHLTAHALSPWGLMRDRTR